MSIAHELVADRRLLLVEDNPTHALLMARSLERIPVSVVRARSRQEAIASLESDHFDAVVLDIGLPDGSGFALQDWLRSQESPPPVVFVTSDDLAESAVSALRNGAVDYFVKRPNYVESLTEAIQSLLCDRVELCGANTSEILLGNSRSIRRARTHIETYAREDSPVLVTGETGTGKELVANALHELSPRSSGPFVPINCSAVAEDLFEPELFGSVRGAFTGSVSDQPGVVGAAHGGTVFLDEIGDIGLRAQAKLLRFLETGRYRRVGDAHERPADVRVLAATNRDIDTLRGDSRFRSDLYYRLAVLRIEMPPLRERSEDIELLARHFLGAAGSFEMTDSAINQLVEWHWPGNVRELRHTVERTRLHARNGRIALFEIDGSPTESKTDDRCSRVELERTLVSRSGRLGPVASELGVSVRTVQRRMKRWGLHLMDYRR